MWIWCQLKAHFQECLLCISISLLFSFHYHSLEVFLQGCFIVWLEWQIIRCITIEGSLLYHCHSFLLSNGKDMNHIKSNFYWNLSSFSCWFGSLTQWGSINKDNQKKAYADSIKDKKVKNLKLFLERYN